MEDVKSLVDIANKIILIRDEKVMLDRDLAELYGVDSKVLVQAIKRNENRFPPDFMFKLNSDDLRNMGSQLIQIYGANARNYMERYPPYAFTEPGCLALSFVLNSEKASEMGLFIVRSFTHLRRFVLKNENLLMELKNAGELSKTFSNFEKKIEQNLIVLYKNNSKKEKELKRLRVDLQNIQEILKNNGLR